MVFRSLKRFAAVVPLALLALPDASCGGRVDLITAPYPRDVDAGVDGAISGGPSSPGFQDGSTSPSFPDGVALSGSCPSLGIIATHACPTVGLECEGFNECDVMTPCECTPAGWSCAATPCEAPPKQIDKCKVRGPCAAEDLGDTCTLRGEGPCSSDVELLCTAVGSDLLYIVQSFQCDEGGSGCGIAGGGCEESCMCEDGIMVCSGDCADGGLGSP